MMDLMELYASVDDWYKEFKTDWDKHLLASGKTKRGPEGNLSVSEIMTILIMFHQSGSRNFKYFYSFVTTYLRSEFPDLVSYPRFVALKKSVMIPLFAYLTSLLGSRTGISIIDSTKIVVCHNKRISSHKVFKNWSQTGKTTTGWFHGFKLHLIISDKGELLAFRVTPGNISDVSQVESLSEGFLGKLFGDKGYISAELAKSLLQRGLELITNVRSNMKPKAMSYMDSLLLKKRGLIETVNDQLKNICQIEHTRHRSVPNFLINMFAGLAAYCHKPKKPSMKFSEKERAALMAA